MSTYKVKSNLNHDGKDYPKGSEVELNEATASKLIRDGVLANPKADVEEDENETVQPAVNNVEREGGNVEGETKVVEGADNQPEAGDDDGDEGKGEDDGEGKDEGEGSGEGEGDKDNL